MPGEELASDGRPGRATCQGVVSAMVGLGTHRPRSAWTNSVFSFTPAPPRCIFTYHSSLICVRLAHALLCHHVSSSCSLCGEAPPQPPLVSARILSTSMRCGAGSFLFAVLPLHGSYLLELMVRPSLPLRIMSAQ